MTYRKFWGVMVNPAEDFFYRLSCELWTLQESLSPDVVMFNAVISSFEKSQQWQRALALLQEMPMKKVTWRCPGGLKGIPGGCGCPQKGWNTFPRSSLGKRHEKKTWTISIQNMDQNHFAEALCCTPAESCQLNHASWIRRCLRDFRTWNWGETKPSELQLYHQRLWEREPMAAGHLSLSVSSGYGR